MVVRKSWLPGGGEGVWEIIFYGRLNGYKMRKIVFQKDNKKYAIVAAIGGKYFRVQEIKPNGIGGRYVDLNLKDPSISGEFQGKARKAEWLRLTHFRMTYKKGTV